jgi:hypothetical protein
MNKFIIATCIGILSLLIPLLFSGCENYFENHDKHSYYEVKGVGYVYNKKTKQPVANGEVCVTCSFKHQGIFTTPPITEYYPIDGNGYFTIKFLKRTEADNVLMYRISARVNGSSNFRKISYGEVAMAKSTIQFDTIWVEPSHIQE